MTEKLSPKLQAAKAKALTEKRSLKQQRSEREKKNQNIALVSTRWLIMLGVTRWLFGGAVGVALGGTGIVLGWGVPVSVDVALILVPSGLLVVSLIGVILAKTRRRAAKYSETTTGVVTAARVVGRPGSEGSSGISYSIDAVVQYEAGGRMCQVTWYPRGASNLHSTFKKKAERLLGTSLPVAFDPAKAEQAVIGRPENACRYLRVLFVSLCILHGFGCALTGINLIL